MENFSRPLVDWYKKEARPLPWREEPTPYRVWVSEIMLQQTRIEAAREYFNRFTRAFPTVEALAAAELDDVLKLWEGLGYYSRAQNLHKCAKTVCKEFGGVFPADAAALRALPGIGDYTAGAIASIAYGLPEPAVDGNVLRVLARMECFGESIGSDKVKKRFREALRAIYPAGDCGAFTSALMELGETICTVGTPECARCPVAAYCEAHRRGEETLYPVLPEKKPRRIENRRVLLLLCGDTVAVRRRESTGLLASMWELPNDLAPEAPENGEPCGAVILLVDITEKEKREKLRREFTANVSHELKTPLTSICGISDMLMNGIVKPEDVKGFGGDINREAARLLALVNDIIRLSELDEGAEDTDKAEITDILEVANDAVKSISGVAKKAGITVTAEGDSTLVNGGKSLIFEMIYNLCDNAVKYNRENGTVKVRIKDKGDFAEISVADTGIGIPEDQKERVFERFFRVDKSHSKEVGGTGLGLSIVKHAVKNLGGEVSLESRLDKGTTVTVTIPKE
mgnify:CR=1 FL=1